MKSSATVVVSSTVLLVLAAAACSSATEWSPEDIGNIASAAADSRELETLDVSEHLNRPRPSPTYNKAITQPYFSLQSSGIVKRTTSVRLCGDQLVNAIVLACSQFRRKRSAEGKLAERAKTYETQSGQPTLSSTVPDDVRSLYASIFKPAGAGGDSGYGVLPAARGRAGWLIDPPSSAERDSAAYRKFETIGMLRHMRKRAPGGPAQECCRTPCQLRQLVNYC